MRAGVQEASYARLELDYGARITSFDKDSPSFTDPSFTDQFVMEIPPSLPMRTLLDMLLVHFRHIGLFTETEILAKFHTWTLDGKGIYNSKGFSAASCISTTTLKAVQQVLPSDSDDSEPAPKRQKKPSEECRSNRKEV